MRRKEFYEKFGETILKERRLRKMTRRELSELLGVQQMTVYNWEMAKFRIHGLEMLKLITLFGLDQSELLK